MEFDIEEELAEKFSQILPSALLLIVLPFMALRWAAQCEHCSDFFPIERTRLDISSNLTTVIPFTIYLFPSVFGREENRENLIFVTLKL